MKTLIHDEEEPRPMGPTISSGTNTSGMSTSVNVTFYFQPTTDPQPPREVYRTQGFVDRHRELEQ